MSTTTPFFTILVPTKNRHHIVGYAIQSVLDQTFEDFEIVVMDNDDGELTKEALANFKDTRVRYYRSGGLNMSQNWERALEKSTGKFVTVLEDKQAYYPFALKVIHDAIVASNSDVVVWEWDVYEDQRNLAISRRRSEIVKSVSSRKILDFYVNDPSKAGSYMPRMLNSCIRSDIIVEIKKHPNVDRFFSEYAPDLCAAFYSLAYVNEVHLLNRGIGLVGYNNLSNAVRGRLGDGKEVKYYGVPTGRVAELEYVPIKSLRLTYNTVYNDYLRLRSEIGGKLEQYTMNAVAYAKVCLWDVVRMYNSGADPQVVLSEFRLILEYLRRERLGLREYASISLFVLYVLKMTIVKVWRKLTAVTWEANDIYSAAGRFPSPPPA